MWGILAVFASGSILADEVRFSRDVLPILADRCFHCHGPDPSHREADLRLDERESATSDNVCNFEEFVAAQ